MTLAVHSPFELAEALTSVNPFPAVIVTLSIGLKPEPRTSTTVPGDPLERSTLNPAPRISVTAWTLSADVREPDARVECAPDGREGTISVADQEPLASAKIPVATGLLSIVTVIAFSFMAKPAPVAVTGLPGGILRRSNENIGVTVNVLWVVPWEEW